MHKNRQPVRRLTALLLLICLLCAGIEGVWAAKAVDESKLASYRYTSREAYVEMIKPIARKVGIKYDYLPSVLAAQCIQETNYGGVEDPNTASMVKYNNHLGMKSDMLNDTWSYYTVWPGVSYLKRTPEWENGSPIHITDSFRIYNSVEQCLVDYVMFMKWARKENGNYKYREDVIGNPSYQRTIRSVRVNGYCTDPAYDNSVCSIIRKWNLTELDNGFGMHAEAIRLNRVRALKLKKGKSFALKARVIPSNACNKEVRFRSSNAAVASVSSTGVIQAKNKGTAVIYAISRDDSRVKAKLTVKVG